MWLLLSIVTWWWWFSFPCIQAYPHHHSFQSCFFAYSNQTYFWLSLHSLWFAHFGECCSTEGWVHLCLSSGQSIASTTAFLLCTAQWCACSQNLSSAAILPCLLIPPPPLASDKNLLQSHVKYLNKGTKFHWIDCCCCFLIVLCFNLMGEKIPCNRQKLVFSGVRSNRYIRWQKGVVTYMDRS